MRLSALSGIIFFLLTNIPGYPCTSFCLTDTGNAILACNLDFDWGDGLLFINKRGAEKTGWIQGTTGRVARWTSRHGSVVFSLVGKEYAWGGMNEAGLAVSTMALAATALPPPDERPALEQAVWIQYLLDTCAAVGDIPERFTGIRMQNTSRYADHYLVCDAAGGCAVIEFINGQLVFRSGASLPVKALANDTYADSYHSWTARSGTAPWPHGPSSPNRFHIAAQYAARYEKQAADDIVTYAFSGLSDASNASTRWSIVHDCRRRIMYFRTDANHTVRRVSLLPIDFSCATPVLLLDVNARFPAADLVPYFSAYSHEKNLRLFTRFLENSHIAFDANEMDRYVRRLEKFPCRSE